MNWCKGLKAKTRIAEPLRKHTTFKIGGPVEFFVEPESKRDVKSLVTYAKKYALPIFVIGSGSNILACDRKLKAIVLKFNSVYFKRITFTKNRVEASSGLMLSRLIRESKNRGLSGVEFLTGIPGTVGGALAMNAGCWGKSIGGCVEKATVMDYNGRIRNLKRNQIKFSYRNSNLSKYIILNATLKLAKRNKDKIQADIKKYLSLRKGSQDSTYPNAGCIFKNPSLGSAGTLIDACGLKGKMIGGACVSGKHANFILNCNNASSDDVLKLMRLVKRKVRNKFNVNLEPEVKIWQ